MNGRMLYALVAMVITTIVLTTLFAGSRPVQVSTCVTADGTQAMLDELLASGSKQ